MTERGRGWKCQLLEELNMMQKIPEYWGKSRYSCAEINSKSQIIKRRCKFGTNLHNFLIVLLAKFYICKCISWKMNTIFLKIILLSRKHQDESFRKFSSTPQKCPEKSKLDVKHSIQNWTVTGFYFYFLSILLVEKRENLSKIKKSR